MLKMKTKKLVSVFLAVTILFSFTSVNALSERNAELVVDVFGCIENERAVFSEQHVPTLKDDFKDDRVIVILRQAQSEVNEVHETREFNSSVSKSHSALGKRASLETQSMSRKDVSSMFSSVEDLTYIEDYSRREEIFVMSEFRQILSLKLSEPGKENVLAAIELLEQDDSVLFAHPCYNFVAVTCGSATQTNQTNNFFSQQWGIQRIMAENAWAVNTGNNQIVRVGVMEGAINGTHPDISPNMIAGNMSLTTAITEDSRHGSAVASVIGATHNNSGIRGVAQHVRMAPLNAVSSSFVQSLSFAASNNIWIINASFSYHDSVTKEPSPPNPSHEQALLTYPGLFIAAAGNAGRSVDIVTNRLYPASYRFSNVISVGATANISDRRANLQQDGWQSNFGADNVHIFAPGTTIPTAIPSNIHATISGTSFATPHVSGTAAILMSKYPNATPAQVKWAILEGTDRGSRLNPQRGLNGVAITGGRLNAHKALLALQSIQNLSNHDMTYGVHRIVSRHNGTRYLGMFSNEVSLDSYFADDTPNRPIQNWVVQRTATNGVFQLRRPDSLYNSNVMMRNNNGIPAMGTGSIVNITVIRNNDGSVTFRDGPNGQALGVTMPMGQATVVWQPFVANAAHQKWYLEPHRSTHQRADVDGSGTINVTDLNWINQYISNTRSFTALQFYQADVNRDGSVNSIDTIAINRFITGQTSLLDGWY
jgi:hypothetical protein